MILPSVSITIHNLFFKYLKFIIFCLIPYKGILSFIQDHSTYIFCILPIFNHYFINVLIIIIIKCKLVHYRTIVFPHTSPPPLNFPNKISTSHLPQSILATNDNHSQNILDTLIFHGKLELPAKSISKHPVRPYFHPHISVPDIGIP